MTIADLPSGYHADDAVGGYADFRAWLNAVKAAADASAPATRAINTDGTSLTGGGNFTADRTLSIKDGGVTPAKIGSRYVAKSGAYTLTSADEIVDCSGTFTVTLPDAAAVSGRVFTIRNSGTGTITIGRTSSQTIDGAAANVALAGKGWLSVVSNGTGWAVLAGRYWSEAVGRRAFEWDTANARWQMIYGDTGWRDVKALTEAAFQASNAGASLLLRRIGNRVMFKLNETAAGSATGTVTIWASVPDGFRNPAQGVAAAQSVDSSTGLPYNQTLYFTSSTLSGRGWTAVRHLAQLEYETADAWPASLPGSPSGSIPA